MVFDSEVYSCAACLDYQSRVASCQKTELQTFIGIPFATFILRRVSRPDAEVSLPGFVNVEASFARIAKVTVGPRHALYGSAVVEMRFGGKGLPVLLID
jgi:hypothetical protein